MTSDPLKELTEYVADEKLAGRLSARQAATIAGHVIRAAMTLQGWHLAAVGLTDALAEIIKPKPDEAVIAKASAVANAGLAMVKEARELTVQVEVKPDGGMVN